MISLCRIETTLDESDGYRYKNQSTPLAALIIDCHVVLKPELAMQEVGRPFSVRCGCV